VQCVLYDPATRQTMSASLAARAGKVPSLAPFHPPASRLERAASDLFGIEFTGLPDPRPWLDHGRWPVQHPLAESPRPDAALPPYRFLEAEGPSLHQIAVGPVHAGIIEPGPFRFTASGETIVRLEERLGYTHKGIDKLLCGKSIEEAARLAARPSGDSTVACPWAFVPGVARGLDFRPPPTA